MQRNVLQMPSCISDKVILIGDSMLSLAVCVSGEMTLLPHPTSLRKPL